jgi:hypothetical protein
MPNTIHRLLVHPSSVKQAAATPVTTEDASSSMVRAANIVELFETGRYDVTNLRRTDGGTLPVSTPGTAGGLISTVQQWLAVVATQLNQGRAGLTRVADHNEITDPLHDSRQAFSTFQMDANRLQSIGSASVPDLTTVASWVTGVVGGFKGGVCEDPDPAACETALTTYFVGAQDFDLAAEDIMWRVGNLRALAASFPPYVAALTEDWVDTIGHLGLPLSACVLYWGVEQTTACSLEIAKYYEKDPRVADYARQQFQRLEQFKRNTELVASVERTRELVIATGRYWGDTRALVAALGPFAGRVWELVESARDKLGEAKDSAWTALKKITSVTEEPADGGRATAAPSAESTATAPPSAQSTAAESPGMRARPVMSASPRQQAVDPRVDAIIQAAQKLAEDAATLKQESTAPTVERQPAGTRRRVRR